ncbi:MAG: SRPBCC domain-containing protein [Mycetocola sp.]
MSESKKTTGPKTDAGWDVGVRKTVTAPITDVWTYLLGAGLPLWLGEITELPSKKGVRYRTDDGVRGTIRGYTEKKQVRLSWQPEDWPHDTTLELTLTKAGEGTTVGIHHEELADREERHMMVGHWHRVLDAIVAHFE